MELKYPVLKVLKYLKYLVLGVLGGHKRRHCSLRLPRRDGQVELAWDWVARLSARRLLPVRKTFETNK